MVGYLVVWLVVMGLLLALVITYRTVGRGLTEPLLATGDPAVQVTILPGMDARRIAELADASGAHLDPTLFYWVARLRGQARAIKAGEYEISPKDTLLSLLDRLVSGDVVRYRVTVPEGDTAQDFLNRLATDPHLKHTLTGLSHAEIIAALSLPIKHLEGQLFPDTYVFTGGTTDRQIVMKAYQSMQAHLDAAWANRAPDLPLKTPEDALILASIVEKETGLADERGKVAGVFINRLNRGMRLQTDPAVIYGVAKSRRGVVDAATAPRSLTQSELRQDTPYNTYVRVGLPPTPIALPSEASLQAVTHPTQTDALYFVANGSGGHTFSRTLQGHNQAVQAWRKLENRRADQVGDSKAATSGGVK
ncbi:hypothetical protein A9404_05610 [Halothiobacillus diazotrophicus]|uniref:Endolytic murein transglycosylase n=1 Tax=Halothiobacillus diazotrophicus TaxID=1860122 RepID=A0A191ZGB5_9GAMM|nr:endolytic transglycosylase MltG [Halothiobacillus diazotrophicus]ANJ66926.1 hypothetical protein A9404_05610 [Halothiobacillus diazotrophicus]